MRLTAIAFLFACCAFAGQPDPNNVPLVLLDEGKTYRVVNGDFILGRDVLDLLLEQSWDKSLQAFIDHALCTEEIAAAKIEVSDSDVEKELQELINAYAKRAGMRPQDVKLESLAREAGVAGGLAALRRQVSVNLGLLRVFQKEKALPETAHIWDPGFKPKVAERMEKLIQQKGLERDPKNLGAGEAVRIGVRGYARADVRRFVADNLRQLPLDELKAKLDILAFERLVKNALAGKNIVLTADDLKFHFSYMCRLKGAATGVDGRMLMLQDLQAAGMSPEQFLQDRTFKADAGITRLAKAPIGDPELRAEFAAHPEQYARSDMAVAHIAIFVLDPDGRRYSPLWKAPGHGPVNEYAARQREEQFAAAKPKIEALIPLAKADFEGTARKHSEDTGTIKVGGSLGRIGRDTTLVLNADKYVRDAALKLKPGEISGPVRSDFGWHLIKCLDKQEVTYEEAAERVYLRLIHDARQALHDAMLKGAKIEDKP